MPSVIDADLGNNYIANGLSGPVFQAAIENRGVFEDATTGAKTGAMYICTGETREVYDGVLTYNVPRVIAVEGPDKVNEEYQNGYYYIHLTFVDGHVSSAKLELAQKDSNG